MAGFSINKYQKSKTDPEFEQLVQTYENKIEHHRRSSSNNTSRRSLPHSIRSQGSPSSEVLSIPIAEDCDDFLVGTNRALGSVSAQFSHTDQPEHDAGRTMPTQEVVEANTRAISPSQRLTFDRNISFQRSDGQYEDLRASLDSGCKPGNYIPEIFVKDFLNENIDPLSKDTPVGRSVTHHDIEVVGQVVLRYKVGNHANKTMFLVAQGSSVGLILGEREIQDHPWLIEGDKDSVGPVQPANRAGKVDRDSVADRARQAKEAREAEQRRQQRAKQEREAKKQKDKDQKR